MNTKTTTNTSEKKGRGTMDKETIDTANRLALKAFTHAIDSSLTEDNREAARTLTNAYAGKEVPEESGLFMIALGFVLGMGEGMGLAADMAAM